MTTEEINNNEGFDLTSMLSQLMNQLGNNLSDERREKLLNGMMKGMYEDFKSNLTENAAGLLKYLTNMSPSDINAPFLVYLLLGGEPSVPVDDDGLIKKALTDQQIEELKEACLDLAKKEAEEFNSLSGSDQVSKVSDFRDLVQGSCFKYLTFQFMKVSSLVTDKIDVGEESMAKLYSKGADLIKFSTEDLFFLLVVRLSVNSMPDAHVRLSALSDEFIEKFEEFGLKVDDPNVGFLLEWRDKFLTKFTDVFSSLGDDVLKEIFKKEKIEKSTLNPTKPSKKKSSSSKIDTRVITAEEFVQAGRDGKSQKAVTKDLEDLENSGDTPYLDRFGLDLCKEAKKGKITPIFGREKELGELIDILCCKKKKSALFIGKAGCGKTSIVEYLATLIVEDKVPNELKNTRLVSIPLSNITAGASMRGELESRLNGIISEATSPNRKVILYMDEMHVIGNNTIDSDSLVNSMKPYLANGTLTMIGSTTEEEYRRYIEKDKALNRRFSKILVLEPSVKDTVDIINKSIDSYSKFHKVKYSEDVVEYCVNTCERYLHESARPDQPLNILDRAGSACKLDHVSVYKKISKKVKSVEDEIFSLKQQRSDLVFGSITDPTKMDEAFSLDSTIEIKEKELSDLRNSTDCSEWPSVSVKDIAKVISDVANIPLDVILEPEINKLAKLPDELGNVVIGQKEAITEVTKALFRSYLGLRNPNRPIASFMFIGPTGVGKTELAKKVAEVVFGTEEAFLRIDGGEYSQSFNDSKLLGAAPGYVGFNTTPSVFDKIKRRPYTLVLVDEVEKIHPDIVNKVFLSILDEGKITLSDKTEVDMKNCIIVFTGNVGSSIVGRVSFNPSDTKEDIEKENSKAYMDALNRYFRKEFLGRLTKVVCFNSLGRDEMRTILDLELVKFEKNSGKTLELSDNLRSHILDNVDFTLGARNLSLALQDIVIDKITDKIIEDKKLIKKKKISADFVDDNVIISFK
jgi:ATP-dependent Clp protease ATP-binding subunit ClpC